MIRTIKPAFNVLQAPYIKVDATVIQNGLTNGKSNIPPQSDYVVAPSAKKIATYIVNQIFGSDLITQSEDLKISWLMPTLKQSLELSIYEEESFIYINIFDKKIYLQCLGRKDIHNLVQKYDKIIGCTIVEYIEMEDQNEKYELHRDIKIENGKTYLKFKAFFIDNNNNLTPVSLPVFNAKTGNDYLEFYILPYEVLINVDLGQNFFKDSKKLLAEEMQVINVIADEIEKTRTRIATSQHYQTGDIVGNWKPATNYTPQTISVGKLQDYFTLLPGDKDHHIFNFLQGDVRIEKYIETFKFYDYQTIQMAGLSTATFGYEKDSYMNVANVDLSKTNSDMTVESIKTQLEPQLNKLFTNVVFAQNALNIIHNKLQENLEWNYGLNEKLDDMTRLQVLSNIQRVSGIPMKYKAAIVLPILKRLVQDGKFEENEEVSKLVEEFNKENLERPIVFGEV